MNPEQSRPRADIPIADTWGALGRDEEPIVV
jgi:hypothetical protein